MSGFGWFALVLGGTGIVSFIWVTRYVLRLSWREIFFLRKKGD